MVRRGRVGGILGAFGLVGLAACGEFFHDPAPEPSTPVMLAYSLSGAGGASAAGPAEALARADRVRVALRTSDGSTLHQAELPFTASGQVTRIELDLVLAEPRVIVTVEAVLLLGTAPLFQGSGSGELRPGLPSEVEVPLVPVAAGIVPDQPPVLTSLGQSIQLQAAVVMATGDTIPDAAVTWSTLDPAVVSVQPGGALTAVSEGQARVVATHGVLTAQMIVTVSAVVASVVVEPATASVPVGGSQQFSATARDELGNALDRELQWASDNEPVATVDASGLALGIRPGGARISATAGGISGVAGLGVEPIPPTAVTGQATGVTGFGAVLNGTVNPHGSPSAARFLWGTTPDPTTPTATEQVGDGLDPAAISATLGNLGPGTTYYFRVQAANAAGESFGAVQQFTTASPPAAPSDLRVLRTNFGFQLFWVDNSDNETDFRIERRELAFTFQPPFVQIAVVGANVTTYLDGDDVGISEYRVRACNAVGCSAYSNIASPAGAPPAGAPAATSLSEAIRNPAYRGGSP